MPTKRPSENGNGTANGALTRNELKDQLEAFTRQVMANNVLSRSSFLQTLSDPRRNLDDECGYPGRWVDPQLYQDLYDREPVATRTVQIYPLECWQVQPTVYEVEDAEEKTAFEEAVDALGTGLRGGSKYADEKGNPVWEVLKRADILSGIGRYGCILFGIDDGRPLHEPAEGWEEDNSFPVEPTLDEDGNPTGEFTGNRFDFGKDFGKPYSLTTNRNRRRPTVNADEEPLPEGVKRRLLYLRVFPESLARITRYETNPTSPRHGFPTEYMLTLNDPALVLDGTGHNAGAVRVHWSRVQHVAELNESSEVFAPPRQQHVLNPILDCRKIRGSSAEGYYKCGIPGYSFETHPELGGDVDVDKEDMRDMVEDWWNGLQRALFTAGFSVKTLSPSLSDPTNFLMANIQAICIKLACPQRVFMGSERGELASSQDDAAWNDRLKERQQNYITPRIICPFVDRLIDLGCLPEPEEYHVYWPDLTSQTDADKAAVALQKTQALGHYVTTGANALLPEQDFFTRFLGMDEEEAEAILEAKMAQLEEQEDGEPTQTSALLQTVGGMTGAVELFKAAKEGALSEDQLRGLLMLFFLLSEERADELVGEGLTPAAEMAGDPPEPPAMVGPNGVPNGPPGKPPPKPGQLPPGAPAGGTPRPPFPPKPPAANREGGVAGSSLRDLYFPANKKLTGGRWITTEDGHHVYIKGGKPVAGNPHVVRELKKGGKEDESGKGSGADSGGGKTSPKGRSKESPKSTPEEKPAAKGKSFDSDGEKIHSWGTEHYGEWANSLDAPTQKAISHYQKTSDVNYYLRNNLTAGEMSESQTKKIVERVDKALERSSVPEAVSVYRGVPSQFAADWKEGAVITDRGFVSTSLSEAQAGRYAHNFLQRGATMEIRVPKGAKGAYLGANKRSPDYELLLPRDSKVRIIGREGDKFIGELIQ